MLCVFFFCCSRSHWGKRVIKLSEVQIFSHVQQGFKKGHNALNCKEKPTSDTTGTWLLDAGVQRVSGKGTDRHGGGWIRPTTFEGTLQGKLEGSLPGGEHEDEKGLKPPSSASEAPWSPLKPFWTLLKPFSSPLQAPFEAFTVKPPWSFLKPPWSPLEALLKPPWRWSLLQPPLEALFNPPWSPLEALLKPPWSPPSSKTPSSSPEALLKPPWSPSQAPLKPSQAPQASFKPFWSPRQAPWKPVQALPKGLFYVRTSVQQLRCPNSCVTTAV